MDTSTATHSQPCTNTDPVGHAVAPVRGSHRAVACRIPKDAPVVEPPRTWIFCSCGWGERATEGMVHGVVNKYAEHLEDVFLRDHM